MSRKMKIFSGIFCGIFTAGVAAAAGRGWMGNTVQDGEIPESGMESASEAAAIGDFIDDGSSSPAFSDPLFHETKSSGNVVASSKGVSPSSSPPKQSAEKESAALEKISSAVSLFSSISSSDESSPPSIPPSCAFPSAPPNVFSSHRIIFNEVAWMGMPSSSASDASTPANDEWIELKNISNADIPLSGWSVADASGKIRAAIPSDQKISAYGFFMLARQSSTLPRFSSPGISYSGALSNSGGELSLFDPQCGIADFIDGSKKWPAGDNVSKYTMERNDDGSGWHASEFAGGTPGKENSKPAPSSTISISIEGSIGSAVKSAPAGILCGVQCSASFPDGAKVVLTAYPASGQEFGGWSGACSGTGVCSLSASGDLSVAATFRFISPVLSDDSGSRPIAAPSSASTGTPVSDGAHPVIAAVQIAGASSANDFIKIFNPSAAPIDASGWKLKKRSQTGTEYSVKEFPAGTSIGAGQYFVWANSADGFSASVAADVSSTQTLAANNSIALFDADGAIVDAVAWGTGSGQFGEGSPYPSSPDAGKILARNFSGGAIADTDSNTDDFSIQ